MSYTPTNWKAGDTVTSAKLNKMEQGIANSSGILVVPTDEDGEVLGKTWQEIYDGGFGIIAYNDSDSQFYELIIEVKNNDNLFTVKTLAPDDGQFTTYIYSAESPDDYPVWQESGSESEPAEPKPEL